MDSSKICTYPVCVEGHVSCILGCVVWAEIVFLKGSNNSLEKEFKHLRISFSNAILKQISTNHPLTWGEMIGPQKNLMILKRNLNIVITTLSFSVSLTQEYSLLFEQTNSTLLYPKGCPGGFLAQQHQPFPESGIQRHQFSSKTCTKWTRPVWEWNWHLREHTTMVSEYDLNPWIFKPIQTFQRDLKKLQKVSLLSALLTRGISSG